VRQALKRLALAVATVAVIPSLASYWIRARLLGADRALEGSTQALGLVPGLTGQYLRRAFLCRVLERCDESVTVEYGVLFSTVAARLGRRVYVGPRCHLGMVDIGDDVLLAAGVHVPSGGHIHGTEDGNPIVEQPLRRSRVHIGQGAWVGSAAVVMADVGSETIVGAGAVVTKALPPRSVAAGVPARVLRTR
jgi:acetyltransferase-like isoleucine patch superfamily enzyme